ncbi:MAG: 30S ribosomal protein S12 methylthiotransferase RimO, partial [Peptococcaceae bacterium]|nr:30S ribosomal protein S12 methylthiotransferase RimO [Peptococcaceae bacterium]
MMKPLLYIETLGCPKNQADSRLVRGMMLEKGYTFAKSPQEAEVILLNTCGFIDDAKEESIQAVLRLSIWKKKGFCRFFVVMGCLPQKYGAELLEHIPEVDLFLGVADWQELAAQIENHINADTPVAMRHKLRVGAPDRDLYDPAWTAMEDESHVGYVKIAEGCGHRCTFCVIPEIRGRYRSRKPDDIVNEIALRTSRGLKEAVLVAQDTGAYGRDLQPASSLAELVRRLCDIESLENIRIMYCYPEEVGDALIEAMRHPKVCPYLDMPIQHVAEGILRRMGRPPESRRFKDVIRKLREYLPDVAIRTTLMVGFPGETEEEFQALLDFLEEFHLERVGFFAFSPQPGTPAEQMPDQVPEEIKEARLEKAQSLQAKLLASWNDSLLGRSLEVVIDEETGMDSRMLYYEGRTLWDAPEIDALVSLSSAVPLEPGQRVRVRITHSQ